MSAPPPPSPAVLRCPAEDGMPVRVARSTLRGLLTAHPDAEAVAFAGRGVALDALGGALPVPGGEVGALAATAPVVDALKRVDADVVVATVDRSALRRVVAPAVVRADLLRTPADDTPADDTPAGDEHVRPLALVARTHRVLPLA